jgi:hypothetical protein
MIGKKGFNYKRLKKLIISRKLKAILLRVILIKSKLTKLSIKLKIKVITFNKICPKIKLIMFKNVLSKKCHH